MVLIPTTLIGPEMGADFFPGIGKRPVMGAVDTKYHMMFGIFTVPGCDLYAAYNFQFFIEAQLSVLQPAGPFNVGLTFITELNLSFSVSNAEYFRVIFA